MNIPQTSASQSRPPARPKLVWSPVKTGSNQPSEHSRSSSYGPLPSAGETVSAVTKGADFQLHVRNGELMTFPRLPVHALQNKQTNLHEEKVFGQKVRWFMVEGILEREVTPSLKEEEKGEEVRVEMGYEPTRRARSCTLSWNLTNWVDKPPWQENRCGRGQSTRMTRRSI